MRVIKSGRGFECLTHIEYRNEPRLEPRLIQQSSVIGDYDDSFEKAGSSFLWVGEKHHLSREEVKHLVDYMQNWLITGYISKEEDRQQIND